MKVKASILTFREAEMTRRCAESLRDQVDGLDIVSNGSDGSAENQLSDFALVSQVENRSFSECVNDAVVRARSSGFDALLFVTNDVTFRPGVVGQLVQVLVEDSICAGVMPLHLREGQEEMVHHAGGELQVSKWKAILTGGGEQLGDGWDRVDVEIRDWIDGGAAIFRLDHWDQVGDWRPDYGFYGEDVDWGYRVSQAGLRTKIHLGARVTHRMSGTSSQYHRWQRYLLARNRALGAKLNLSVEEFSKVYGYLKRSALLRLMKHPFGIEERIFWAGIRDVHGSKIFDPSNPVLDSDPIWERVLRLRSL